MRLAAAIAIICIQVAVPVAAFADCSAGLADLKKTAQSGSLQETEALMRKVADSPRCESWEQLTAEALLSQRLILEARRIDPSFRNPQAVALIDKAVAIDADWHAHEIKGKLLRLANDFRGAQVLFEKAINLLPPIGGTNAPATAWTNEATLKERANLAAEADEAKHLAAARPNATYVASASNSRGEPGGVFSEALGRGAEAVRVPVPILFDYNSAKLTQVGIDAAGELAGYLKDRSPKAITVTGHTDHVGSEAFNLDLSRRRAATVAAFLRDHGISIAIVTVGKGFSEPRKLSEDASYTQAQIDELNRRVEFDWHR